VFRGRLLTGAFGRGEAGEVSFLLFVVYVATDPGQHFAAFGQDRIDDVAAEAPTALVASTVVGEVADSPFVHRLGRKGGVAADVAGGGRVHRGQVGDELLVDVVQLAEAAASRQALNEPAAASAPGRLSGHASGPKAWTQLLRKLVDS
jgi:hypothetical protein